MRLAQRILKQHQHLQPRCRRRFTAAAAVAAHAQQAELLQQLCSQYGLRSAVTIGRSSCGGSGLFRQAAAATQTQPGGQQRLVSVPLRLVLSCTIPGCSPQPAELQHHQQLQSLLHDSSCAETWELQVAVLLLWALRQPPDSDVGGFWRRYARAFIPPLTQQTSLLLWSQQELDELQDRGLTATAAAWQQQACDAYAAVARCFSSSSSSSSTVTLDEWLWAVASVESRAFAVTASSLAGAGAAARPGGDRECVGLVPLLDLANHTCRSRCHHCVDAAAGSFDLFCSSGSSDSSACKEVFISYGDKDNRSLMEQYGFCVAGNPFDRLALPADVLQSQQQQQQQQWMSRDAVKQAGAALKQRLAGAAAPPHLAAAETGGPAAAAARVDAAVASVIGAAGWRNLSQGRAVSAASTAACAAALLRWVRQQQAAYATSAQHDCATLAAASRGGMGSRWRAALAHRLQQKQLLDTAGLLLGALLERRR